jgi:hypothetical protein
MVCATTSPSQQAGKTSPHADCAVVVTQALTPIRKSGGHRSPYNFRMSKNAC